MLTRPASWAACALAVGAIGGLVNFSAWGDIRATQHNLVRSRDKTVSEKQVCVFCHTPSVDIDSLPAGSGVGVVPAWQKSIASDYSFTIYDDIGRLGLDRPFVGSQSIACLSCHDSNQAFSVNRLVGDHPFGVPYRGAVKYRAAQSGPAGGADNASGTSPFRAAQHLKALEDFREVSQGVIEGRRVWWVSRSGITVRRTRNDLPLYGRGVADSQFGLVETVPHIECSSCHDPHTQADSFLRVPSAGSQICLTCHDK
jgi:predicted CXXCH cytochrome family protein